LGYHQIGYFQHCDCSYYFFIFEFSCSI